MIIPTRQDEEPTTPSPTIDELQRQVGEENEKSEAIAIADCKTPTAKQNRIPDVLTCPPAPRKPRVCPAVFPRKIVAMKRFYAPIDLQLEALWSSKKGTAN